jgi:glc operon protein GlcG
MKTIRFSLLTAAAVLLASSAFAQQAVVPDRVEAGIGPQGLPKGQPRPMTVDLAKQLVAAAKKASCAPPAGSCSGAFAVTDDAGVLVYFEALDGVLAGGPELSIRKARASAIWRSPTQVFQDAVNDKSNTAYADGTFPDMTTSPGGVPLVKEGKIVGGFGYGAVGNGGKQIQAALEAEAERLFGKQK